ncbi:Glycosyltransferase family 25 (LPS biosynthesis protein) [Mucilaginibacter lappiensis]|nr:hypothetical protein [Mucilaginibacter lappiensis]SIR61671.1 Glycosyltransferase family 25 (LPS biosynthesis protein) [Mucilaginibacter lappiensis]
MVNNEIKTISAYIINLKSRVDRKEHILKEFAGRPEFTAHVVEACQHKIGAVGLWNTIRHIVQNLVNEDDEYVLICEDDHQFTASYSKELLFNSIASAQNRNADILLGGISWFKGIVQIEDPLFWVKSFNGTQFLIIFRKLFTSLLAADFNDNDTADFKISILAESQFFIHPFISVQKDFGYSDATPNNNQEGHVGELFATSSEWIQNLKSVGFYYENINRQIEDESDEDVYHNLIIPTYVINLPERTDRLEHIKKQFKGKPEFNVTIVEACNHKIGSVGLWQSIRKIINLAMENDDDVIIICEDDHEFTEYYFKEYLMKNIIEAHLQGINYLSGGSSYTDNEILIADNRFWVSNCLATQFIILYKSFFQQIIDEPFDDGVIVDRLLSEMTSKKMVLYPFISRQHDFGYSDVTTIHNENKNLVNRLFEESDKKLNAIYIMHQKYNSVDI